eukprot:Gb_31956 [translate_table: standard]
MWKVQDKTSILASLSLLDNMAPGNLL